MRFEVVQRFAAPVDAVARAFAEPGLYDALAALPKLGAPEVLERSEEGAIVRMRVRYEFTGELAPAARAVLDPSRLTWVDESEHDLARHHVSFRLVADHYADRFRASGTYQFTVDPDDAARTVRTSAGEVKVKAPFVGGAVERAIVSGLREHLDDEVAIVDRWLHDA